MTTITVKASHSYTVEIGRGLLPSLPERMRALLPRAERAFLLSDTNVAPLYLETVLQSLAAIGLSVEHFVLPAGEESKNGESYLALLEALAAAGLTRSDALLALGGGVVGDLAGFTAATYLRGIAFIQVPTTLLAAVDSSIGGKTAIDLQAGKNLAGAFYQPTLVLCDLDTFDTLPTDVVSDGCAEVIKYGMLGSEALLHTLAEQDLSDCLEEVVALCVGMKRDLVERDEFDTGERMRLNLGHTLGHAIEVLSGYRIPHGQGVAAGMAVFTRAAVRKGLCPASVQTLLEALLKRYKLPTQVNFSADALYSAALGDKKRAGSSITIVHPTAVGQSALRRLALSELRDWIEMGLAP